LAKAVVDVAPERISALPELAKDQFGAMVRLDNAGLSIPKPARPLTRMIARAFDSYDQNKGPHSAAI
jgi:oxygen-independent coproporphyrinogen-3 oxidase